MTYSNYDKVDRDRLANESKNSPHARLEVMEMMGKKVTEEYREQVAGTLLAASLTIISSDYLLDHQFVVSRGVYEAARRAAEKDNGVTETSQCQLCGEECGDSVVRGHGLIQCEEER